MRLSREREAELLAAARRFPKDHLTFAEEMHTRADGTLIVHRDGVQERLHRRLYRLVIDPALGRRQLVRTCKTWGCVNPHHYALMPGNEPGLRKRCPNGHVYSEVGTTPSGHCAACDLVRQARRSAPGVDGGARNAAKTACPANHPYDAENTHWARTPYGWRRQCRACARARAGRRRSGIS